ncbi:MAG TPA: 2-isopropylmalate synthase [Steroidobacteraceae bacterium]|jgi:2-isopropylmalate synthase|nr:2-isopropylmalate synthase [Steroidobacteraceae bacterium]
MTPTPDRVLIFDTTLRDGEQAPGCSMTQPEKLRVARALAELGVDIIEAGFPAASRGDWESVNAVAREVQGPVIAGLARCLREDIELAAQALKDAPRHRLHLFLATSAIHREFKLKMAQEEIIRRAVEGVKIAREHCTDVEFSPEDASRTELDFLAQVVEAVIDAGATTINIPDTVGYTVPDEFGEVFRYLRKHVRGIDKVTLSVHCHDDLGMAVANSLTAVVAGARQIECTINGIGERAGNCALEEVVMALATRQAFFNVGTGVQTSRLYPTSRLVASITGVSIPRNKAVVGENAFAHEAGIHQHGMLQNRSTYEIMRPEDVGLSRSNLVLGKHSGRHAFRDRVKQLGFELEELELNRVFEEFKALADRKKELFDGDIEALVLRASGQAQGPWSLDTLGVEVHSGSQAVARVRLKHADGRMLEREASGDGPVDAAYKAIVQATGVFVTVRKFEVHAVTIGEDAQGEAILYVDADGRSYRGSSISTNIIEAAGRALLEVINRIELSHSNAARSRAGHREDIARLAQTAV